MRDLVDAAPARPTDADSMINFRYRAIRQLGQGGMGSVTLVEDTLRDNLRLALKIVREDQENPMVIEILKNEFEALSALRHPNIASAYDYGVIEGSGDNFFTSEFVEGINFYDGSDDLSLEDKLDLLVQVCRALEYVHSRGFIHHDLKPDNILITGKPPKRMIKLIDFGLINREFLKSKSIIGTPHYMAPEKIRGMSTDRRVDIYALGVVAYLLFTRRLPFVGTDAIKVVRKHLVEAPLPPRCHLPEMPEALEEVILRLLAKDPADRYFTGADVIRDINQRIGGDFAIETIESQESYIVTGRFVGREGEIGRLKELLEGIRDEDAPTGGAVFVRGAGGVGKSRLLREFRYHAQLRGVPFLRETCTRAGSGSLRPLYRIIREMQSLAPAELLENPDIRRELARLMPDLFPDVTPEAAPSLAPGEDAHRLVHQLVEFILGVARERPLSIFLNDLQWADEVTIELILTLTRRLAAGAGGGDRRSRLLILATMRDDEMRGTPLGEALERGGLPPGVVEMPLEPLEEEEVHQLVTSMLGTRDVPPLFSFHLQQESAGNPLFVEEAMKVLLEGGQVNRTGAEWEFPLTFEDVELPKTLPEVLQNRLKRIEPEGRQILRFLAAVDRPATAEQIAQCNGVEPVWLAGVLRNLERRQIIDAAAGAEVVEYAFAHNQVKEVVYGEMDPAERDGLHLQIGEALEAMHGDEAEKNAVEIAYHFLRSPEKARSIRFGLLAGQRLSSLYAYREAESVYRQVLEKLGGADFAVRVKVLGRLADLAAITGRYDEGIETLERMLETGKTLLNARSRGIALAKIGGMHIRRSEPDAAIEAIEKGIAEVQPLGPSLELAHLLSTLGLAHLRKGDPKTCLERCDEAKEAARSAKKTQSLAATHNTAGMARFGLGQYDEALAEYEAGLDICRETGNRQGQGASYSNIGIVLLERGAEADASKALQKALQIFEEIGDRRAIGSGEANLAELLLARGDIPKGMIRIQKAVRIAEELGDRLVLGKALAIQGQFLTAHGELAEADTTLAKAEELCREAGDPREVCRTRIAQAELHRVWNTTEGPRERVAEAVAIARERAWPYLEGRALLQSGDASADPAETIFRRLGCHREIALSLLDRAHRRVAESASSAALHLVDEAESFVSRPSPGMLLRFLWVRGRSLAIDLGGEEELRRALEIAVKSQARPIALGIAADILRLLDRRGKEEEARALASEASAILRDMTDGVPTRLRPAYLRMPAVRVIRKHIA